MLPPRPEPQGPTSQLTEGDTVHLAEQDTLEFYRDAPPPPPSAWEQALFWMTRLWWLVKPLVTDISDARRVRRPVRERGGA